MTDEKLLEFEALVRIAKREKLSTTDKDSWALAVDIAKKDYDKLSSVGKEEARSYSRMFS